MTVSQIGGSRYKEPINVQVSFIDYLVFKVFGATAFMNRYADYREIIFQEYISMDENIKYKNINMNTRYLKIAIVVASFFALGFFSGKAQGFDENGEAFCLAKNIYFEW